MKHREIQPAHEESVLNSFSEYYRSLGRNIKVVDRPDPPDAIVEIDNEICWIEITDAFQSSDWAQSITSYAADDKEHKPYQRRIICEPDEEACEKVREVIIKKVEKESLNKVAAKSGKGILLVGCYTPLTTPEEIIVLSKTSLIAELSGMPDIFKLIYLYENTQNGHVFTQLL